MRRRDLLTLAGAGLTGTWLSPTAAAPGPFIDPWLQAVPAERLRTPLYRAPGAARFTPAASNSSWATIAKRVFQARAESWSLTARRAERVGFYLGSDLTNEEAYLWARVARLAGIRLERQGERLALAVGRALETTFGQPAAPNHWLELPASRGILVLGDTSPNYPAFTALAEARRRGARIWQCGGRNLGGMALPILPGSEVALLGGLARFAIASGRIDIEYLALHTNALFQLVGDFGFEEGRFSGFLPGERRYDPESWSYELDGDGRPARGRGFEDQGTVFAGLVRFYAPYTPAAVGRATGLGETAVRRFYEAALAPELRPFACLYAVEPDRAPAFVEQTLRAAAVACLLLGQPGQPGGGVMVLAPGWNPQGTADVGALGSLLPGYCGPPPLVGEDLLAWIRRNGVRSGRRLLSLLHAWLDAPGEDYGFSALPTARPDESLVRTDLDLLVCVGSDPLATGEWNLDRLRTLVVLTPDAGNRTARSWQKRLGSQTEVFVLPLALPSEREGTTTDTGRRLIAHPVERRADLVSSLLLAATNLWQGLRTAATAEPRDQLLRIARPFPGPEPGAVLRDLIGEAPSLTRIDRSEQNQPLACPVSIYAGLSPEVLGNRLRPEPGPLSLFPEYGLAWPEDVRVLGNRASANARGESRVRSVFMVWNGERWEGPDTPDLADPGLPPEAPSSLRAFRGTPEGVARLFAANYASGLNLDTGIAYYTAPLPYLGPLPAYYSPWGSRRPNPISPVQAEPPRPPA